jgi:beta-amylase
VGQPHWGNSGPHDAGSYCQWPHQTGFFHHQGSWYSEYGRFFLQWYSSLLLQHADQLLSRARRALFEGGSSDQQQQQQPPQRLRLHARLPTIHWWYNQAAHAAELTAGLYNTGPRNGYLGCCQVLARHGAGLVLTGGEMRDCEQPSYALASPESLLLQLRATAASQQVPVTLSNLASRFDGDALGELERKAFEGACYRGVDLEHVDAIVFNAVGEAMFEPHHWVAFKDWAGRLRTHNEALRQPARRSPSAAAAAAQRAAGFVLQQQQVAAAAIAAAAAGATAHAQPLPQQQQQQQQQQHSGEAAKDELKEAVAV